jgi:hypothetical protein
MLAEVVELGNPHPAEKLAAQQQRMWQCQNYCFPDLCMCYCTTLLMTQFDTEISDRC